jgi:hypothetical protein
LKQFWSEGNLGRKIFFMLLIFLFLMSVLYQIVSTKETKKARIYVKDRQTGLLVSEKVIIPNTTDQDEKLFWVLKELISGPAEAKYEKIFNPNIEIQKVIIRQKIAYVSFGWNLVDSLHDEPKLVIQSIVNSTMANIKSLKGVKILIDGIEPVSTFCGISLLHTFKHPL